MTNKLAEKAVKVFALPLENLPFEADWEDLAERSAEVLFSALKKENLDSRIAEGLPWLVFTFPEMDWERLIKFAKIFDLQNQLGFVVSLAGQLAKKVNDKPKFGYLSKVEKSLNNSRLFIEAVLANKSITEAEKKYLKNNRPKEAKHWRVLSDLSINHLDYI